VKATAGRPLPITPWLRGYDRAWLVRDLIGGLAAGAVVIPQAMAYATLADLPAQVGLYTCMVPMAVYPLLGGSRTLSVSTTSTVAILTGSTLLAAGIAAGSDDPSRALATLTLLVGVILLIARALRLGVLIDNISEATLTGIKVGVGLTVAAGQLPSLLGIKGDPTADNFVAELRAVIDNLADISWTTVAFSAATLAVLVGLRRAAPQVPGPLVAVAGGILLVALASVDEHGVALIAPVPSGLPTPVVPSLDHLEQLPPGAFAIAIMVFLETLAVGRAVRRKSEPPIDNDQELLASGLSCAAGAFFRAMPSAGGFSQTAINQRAGARTQLSELVTVALAIGCALFLGPIPQRPPPGDPGLHGRPGRARADRPGRLRAVLAAQPARVLGRGHHRGQRPGAGAAARRPRRGAAHPAARPGRARPGRGHRAATHPRRPGPPGRRRPHRARSRTSDPALRRSLYTANVRSANRKIITSVDRHPGTEVLVLDATALGELSITVIEEFAELERELGDRGVSLWMAGLPPNALLTARQTPRWAELDQATGSTRPPDRPNGRACVPCPLTAGPPQLSVDARSCTSAASRSNPSSRTSPHRRGALARSTARCGFRPPGQVPGAPLGGRQQAPP
jgi:sulfate permease, SulP family